MTEPCRDMCVLVRNIVDTAHARGYNCPVDVRVDRHCEVIPSCQHRGSCRCFEFISATAGPCVTLVDAVIEPSRTRPGSCLRATLIVPVSVIVRADGVNRRCRGEICIPIEATMRGACGPYPELVAQASVRVCRGCYADGCVRLWVDYTAEVHAICMRAVRMPVLGPCDGGCDTSCDPFFNLPLYPGG